MPETAPTPLTEEWLKANGFHWHDVERSPCKHWLLWLGPCQPNEDGSMFRSFDDFGLELSKFNASSDAFHLWFRADYAGRYSRFLFARIVRTVEQLTRLIESLTDQPWNPANIDGGAMRSPAEIERLKKHAERIDWRIAESQERAALSAGYKPSYQDKR